MKVIGVAGGMGSGKSLVCKLLEQKGGFILDADKINHSIMLHGNQAYNEIVNYFGTIVLNDSLEIDRKLLAGIVFNNRDKLDKLISINHKYVVQHILEEINNKKINSLGYKFCVIDAPLLIEADLHKHCDYVIIVYADEEIRVERIIKRDGIDRDMVEKRLASQLSYEALKQYGDFIITNNAKDYNELEKEIEEILSKII